jgi:hypothetical protein
MICLKLLTLLYKKPYNTCMSGKEGGRRISKRNLIFGVAAAGAVVVADRALENPIARTLFGEEKPVQPEFPKQNSLREIADKYTTAGPAIDRAVEGLTPEQIEESIKTHPIRGSGISGRGYSLEFPFRDQEGQYVHSLSLFAASSQHDTVVGEEKTVISAYLSKDGIELQDGFGPEERKAVPHDELRRRAGDFIKVTGIGEDDGWVESLPSPNSIYKATGIEKTVVLADGQTMEVKMTAFGRVHIEIVKDLN